MQVIWLAVGGGQQAELQSPISFCVYWGFSGHHVLHHAEATAEVC